MVVHGAARLRVVDRLERDALDEARLLLGELTTGLLALRIDRGAGLAALGVDVHEAVDPAPVEAYLPAGRAAANVLEVFVRRIAHVEAGLVAR